MQHLAVKTEHPTQQQPHLVAPILLNEVMAYENDAVVARIAKDSNLTETEAGEIFDDTKRFLYLCGARESPDPLAPPPMIDEGWHTFILFTADYANFCHRFFDRFIHHRPRRPDDIPGNGSPAVRTMGLVEEVFGGVPSRWWVFENVNADCSPSTNCQDDPPYDCAAND